MKEIMPNDLKERLESGEPLAVVDIRESDEFGDWHIHGSVNFPMYNALNSGQYSTVNEKFQGFPNDKPIVAVCRMGQTSQVAVDILESMGYEAINLIGGIHGWSNAWTEARVPASKSATLIQIRRNGKGCLSYLLGKNGKAAVVDPCVEVSVYTSIAAREGLTITHVLETHVHADHISRARALCEATGAPLLVARNDRVKFPYTPLEHDQILDIGGAEVRVIATPGHTQESVCFDVGGEILLSGDTLFVENIGRPDLEKGDAGAEAGAKMLYESLHERILKLDEEIWVCPGHTSAPIGFDGVPIAARLGDIAPQVDLLEIEKDAFIKTIPQLLGRKPPNFEAVLSINEGRADLGAMDPLNLEAGPNRCAVGKW